MPISTQKWRNVSFSSPPVKLNRHWLVYKSGWTGGDRDAPKWYRGHYVSETKTSGTWQDTRVEADWDVWIESGMPNVVESRLHAKIVDALGERAEVGTTLAEWRSAADMVHHNAMRLAGAALMLKKGRFKEFLNVLNVKPFPRHKHWLRSSPKVASSLWIEYWFGIAPTINDIQTAARILDSDPTESASSWTPYAVTTGARFDIMQSESYYYPMLRVPCEVRAKAGGEFKLVNPNLALASKLGILNPLTIALNITPWSWLLGWFVNLNQWVDSLSSTAGYEFRNCYVTKFTTFDGLKRWKGYADFRCKGYYMQRDLRLPVVKLHLKRFNLSLTRAATAVSLLTLRLKSL